MHVGTCLTCAWGVSGLGVLRCFLEESWALCSSLGNKNGQEPGLSCSCRQWKELEPEISSSIFISVALLLKNFPDAFPFSLLEDQTQRPLLCMEQCEQSPCPNRKEFISIWVLVLQQSNPIAAAVLCVCSFGPSFSIPLITLKKSSGTRHGRMLSKTTINPNRIVCRVVFKIPGDGVCHLCCQSRFSAHHELILFGSQVTWEEIKEYHWIQWCSYHSLSWDTHWVTHKSRAILSPACSLQESLNKPLC